MGDSNAHNHRRLPLLLAGHACGQLKGNLHRACADGTPQANLLLTILHNSGQFFFQQGRITPSTHKLGMEIDSIGDSTVDIAI